MRRWSAPGAPLTEEELIAAYAVGDRAVPHLRLNMVTSLDGAVTLGGLSGGLSSEDDQDLLGRLRMLADVVLVGAGTLRAEGYNGLRLSRTRRAWRVARGLPENPVLAVVSAGLELDPAGLAFADAPVRPIVITRAGASPERRAALAGVADVLVRGQEEVDLAAAVAALTARGLCQVVCEGGPQLLGALTARDLVDELCLSLSPVLAGAGAGRITAGAPSVTAHRLRPSHVLSSDDGFLFLRYVRH